MAHLHFGHTLLFLHNLDQLLLLAAELPYLGDSERLRHIMAHLKDDACMFKPAPGTSMNQLPSVGTCQHGLF